MSKGKCDVPVVRVGNRQLLLIATARLLVACGDAAAADEGAAAEPGQADAGTEADAAALDTSDGETASGDGAPQQGPIEVGDFVFEVRTAGPADGEAVILLHGFPQTSHEWLAQLDALSGAGYRVVAPNQRGYSPGARPEAVEDYAITLLVQDVLDLADALGIDRFHLVGHDWGAAVAWRVAVAAPERLYSLSPISVTHPDAMRKVLNDPSSCQSQASSYFTTFAAPDSEDLFLANDASFLQMFYGTLPQDTADFYIEFFTSDTGALTGALNWYRANTGGRDPDAPEVGPVVVPTMFTWSDGDRSLCRDTALLTGDYVDGPYRFEIIEDVNHWVPDQAPEQVTQLLLEHLAEHAADQ